MAGGKKGITYKVGYKSLKKMIAEKLDEEHDFQTKKERKQALKGALKETRMAFGSGTPEYLKKSLENGLQKYFQQKSRENIGGRVPRAT